MSDSFPSRRNATLSILTAMSLGVLAVTANTVQAGDGLAKQHVAGSGQAAMAWGRSEKAYTGTRGGIARQFIAERRAALTGAAVETSSLKAISHRDLDDGTLVDVRSELNGLPIFNSTARVLVDAGGHVTHMTDEIKSAAAPAGAMAATDFVTTADAARSRVAGLALEAAGERGLWAVDGTARPCYRIRGSLRDSAAHAVPYQFVILAESGEIVDKMRLRAEEGAPVAARVAPLRLTDSASSYRIRLTLDDISLSAARAAGLTDAVIGEHKYDASLETLNALKSSHLQPTLLGGRTVVTHAPAVAGSDECCLSSHAAQSIDGQSGISGDNNGLGFDIADQATVDVSGQDTAVPAGAVITGITYRLRIAQRASGESFFAGDYEVLLSTESLIAQGQAVSVYGPVGGQTDGNNDDDPENDLDIFLNNRTTAGLNGQPADQAMHLIVIDRGAGDVGNLRFVELNIDWSTDGGAGSGPCTPAGDTRVFDPNPVTTLGTIPAGVIPAGAFRPVDLTAFLNPAGSGPRTLSGPACIITDIEGPASPPPSSNSATFGFDADAQCFTAVNSFFHVSQAKARLAALGLASVFPQPLPCDHQGLNLDINAHYSIESPGTVGNGYLAFGRGLNNRPMAEDADVVYHEFGHAIQDHSRPGAFFRDSGIQGVEAGAMGEGFGDYWAFSMTFDAASNGPAHDPDSIAEWAFPGGLRRTDGTKHFPENILGEVHDDGEIWSAALVQIFRAIGREASDKVILRSHFLVPEFGPTFADGAAAILAADDQLFGGAHAAAIRQIFVNRGILNGTPGPVPGPAPTPPPAPGPAPAPAPSPDDSAEENDRPEDARVLSLEQAFDLICLDDDWFALANVSGRLTVEISGAQGDLDLFVFDANRRELARSAGDSSNESVTVDVPAGDYLILVTPFQGQTGPYRLIAHAVAPPTPAPVPQPSSPPSDPGPSTGGGLCGAPSPLAALAGLAGLCGMGARRRRR